MTARELIAFAGPVQCERAPGAVNLVLRGSARVTQGAHAGASEVLFSDASAVALPADLRDARVIALADESGSGPRRFRIESPELQLDLQARSAQLHRDSAAAFFGAVPPPRVPLRLRLGWWLLLTLLRIPGAGRLLGRFRGST